MTRRDVAVMITTSILGLRLKQGGVRCALVQLSIHHFEHAATSW
jgi:hypothetical protein